MVIKEEKRKQWFNSYTEIESKFFTSFFFLHQRNRTFLSFCKQGRLCRAFPFVFSSSSSQKKKKLFINFNLFTFLFFFFCSWFHFHVAYKFSVFFYCIDFSFVLTFLSHYFIVCVLLKLFAGQNMLKYLTHKLRTQTINEDNNVHEKVRIEIFLSKIFVVFPFGFSF